MCPYQQDGWCEVESCHCWRRLWRKCPHYLAEQDRLDAVIAACSHATRRQSSPEEAWCHAEDEAHKCCISERDCPTHLWARIQLLESVLQGEVRKCGYCGALFHTFQLWDNKKKWCSRRCHHLAAAWRARRRRGAPIRGRRERRGAAGNTVSTISRG